jgi:hypothetical protein
LYANVDEAIKLRIDGECNYTRQKYNHVRELTAIGTHFLPSYSHSSDEDQATIRASYAFFIYYLITAQKTTNPTLKSYLNSAYSAAFSWQALRSFVETRFGASTFRDLEGVKSEYSEGAATIADLSVIKNGLELCRRVFAYQNSAPRDDDDEIGHCGHGHHLMKTLCEDQAALVALTPPTHRADLKASFEAVCNQLRELEAAALNAGSGQRLALVKGWKKEVSQAVDNLKRGYSAVFRPRQNVFMRGLKAVMRRLKAVFNARAHQGWRQHVGYGMLATLIIVGVLAIAFVAATGIGLPAAVVSGIGSIASLAGLSSLGVVAQAGVLAVGATVAATVVVAPIVGASVAGVAALRAPVSHLRHASVDEAASGKGARSRASSVTAAGSSDEFSKPPVVMGNPAYGVYTADIHAALSKDKRPRSPAASPTVSPEGAVAPNLDFARASSSGLLFGRGRGSPTGSSARGVVSGEGVAGLVTAPPPPAMGRGRP